LSDLISEKACAKINLALHVVGRHDDGYHELDSVVAFADYGDLLEISVADQLTLECTGRFASAVPAGSDNVVIKAWHVLHEILQHREIKLPPVHVKLEKNLPVASGIGGGSADAAAMLRGLLRIVNQELSIAEIKAMARSLGADVPVCFYQKSCHMQGIGETISTLTIALPRAIVLVNPLKPCSTAEVFRNLGLANGEMHGTALDIHNPPQWRNDLTQAALQVQTEIADVLKALNQEPSFSAVRMSGSGATCFGLSNSMAEANAAMARLSVKNPGWWVKASELL
jgi:4-diphosphocytidyl-2-C-methyl-D-erythritol kinase